LLPCRGKNLPRLCCAGSHFADRGTWDDTLETFINSHGDPSQFKVCTLLSISQSISPAHSPSPQLHGSSWSVTLPRLLCLLHPLTSMLSSDDDSGLRCPHPTIPSWASHHAPTAPLPPLAHPTPLLCPRSRVQHGLGHNGWTWWGLVRLSTLLRAAVSDERCVIFHVRPLVMALTSHTRSHVRTSMILKHPRVPSLQNHRFPACRILYSLAPPNSKN